MKTKLLRKIRTSDAELLGFFYVRFCNRNLWDYICIRSHVIGINIFQWYYLQHLLYKRLKVISSKKKREADNKRFFAMWGLRVIFHAFDKSTKAMNDFNSAVIILGSSIAKSNELHADLLKELTSKKFFRLRYPYNEKQNKRVSSDCYESQYFFK